MSVTRSTEKMFMLPVSKAKALNIVVDRPCWKYGGANMLSFNCLSMAFQGIKRCYRILRKESFETNRLYVSFLFLLS